MHNKTKTNLGIFLYTLYTKCLRKEDITISSLLRECTLSQNVGVVIKDKGMVKIPARGKCLWLVGPPNDNMITNVYFGIQEYNKALNEKYIKKPEPEIVKQVLVNTQFLPDFTPVEVMTTTPPPKMPEPLKVVYEMLARIEAKQAAIDHKLDFLYQQFKH